tara:strand:+ start:489 stop:842 length:354 start_codon:yes stop_codon:yes gene_type:complete
MTDSDLEAINVKLDRLLALLSNKTQERNLPTYSGSRELDYILEEAYTNNESIHTVIERHNKTAKAKNGKDLDRLDEALRENAPKTDVKTPIFNDQIPPWVSANDEWDDSRVHDSEGF